MLRSALTNLRASPSPFSLNGAVRHATKKAGGSSKNGRDSPGQHFGVKLGGGSRVRSGNIIVTQRGTKFRPGANVRMGRNHTLFSIAGGTKTDDKEYVVKFEKIVHNTKKRNLVSVVPREEYNFGSATNPLYLTKDFEMEREKRAQEKIEKNKMKVLRSRGKL